MGKRSCVFWWGQGCQSWRKSPLDMVSSLRTSAKRDSRGSGWEPQHRTFPQRLRIYYLPQRFTSWKQITCSQVAPGSSDVKAKGGSHDSRNTSSSMNRTFSSLLFHPLPRSCSFPLLNSSVYAAVAFPLSLLYCWDRMLISRMLSKFAATELHSSNPTSLFLPGFGPGWGLIGLLPEEWVPGVPVWRQRPRIRCSILIPLAIEGQENLVCFLVFTR